MIGNLSERKRHRANIVLCYHGCVRTRAEVLALRQHIEDLRHEVQGLIDAGYIAIFTSQYNAWYLERYTPDAPVFTVQLDDGLDSVALIAPWFIREGIPFNLALITRRQRKLTPDGDFLSWAQVREWVDSGLCELLRHTHNLHHLTFMDSVGTSAPLLEGPCWIDDGDVVYRALDDDRWHWDYSFVDSDALAFPLFGCDPASGFQTPITSRLILTPKTSQTVTALRVWTPLHVPTILPGMDHAGYDVNVRVTHKTVPEPVPHPPVPMLDGLANWFSVLGWRPARISLVGDDSIEGALYLTTLLMEEGLYSTFDVQGVPTGLLPETVVLNHGEAGRWASDWGQPFGANEDDLDGYVEDIQDAQADLYVVCFGAHDMRNSRLNWERNHPIVIDQFECYDPDDYAPGGAHEDDDPPDLPTCDDLWQQLYDADVATWRANALANLTASLATICTDLTAANPACSILLVTPAPFTADDPDHDELVNPIEFAQAYNEIMRGAYLAMEADPAFGNVAVLDTMTDVFTGTVPVDHEDAPLMGAQLFPNEVGYVAVAHAIFNAIRLDHWTRAAPASTLLGDITVKPFDYETRSQWQEREFITIALPDTFDTIADEPFELTLETLNVGPGMFRVYATANSDKRNFRLYTTSELSSETGTDYPANTAWFARPLIILSTGTGRQATDAEYRSYVDADIAAQDYAVAQYLRANWTAHGTDYDEAAPAQEAVSIAGTYDYFLQPVDALLSLRPDVTHDTDLLRIKTASPQGIPYNVRVELSYSESDVGPWASLGYWGPSWVSGWQEIEIPQITLEAGKTYWFRFRTLFPSPHSKYGVIRVFKNRPMPLPPFPVWNPALARYEVGETFATTRGYYEVPQPAYYTAIVPKMDTQEGWDLPAREVVSDVYPWIYWMSGDGPWYAFYEHIKIKDIERLAKRNSFATRRAYAAGELAFESMSRSIDGVPPTLPTIIYPFGSYYDGSDAVPEIQSAEASVIHPELADAFDSAGIEAGYTIWASRNRLESDFRIPDCRPGQHSLGRYMVYGDMDPRDNLRALEAYAGIWLPDARHDGVRWQVSLEPDPAGNATVRRCVAALDYVAFDAYFVGESGTIIRGELNDGGTYDGTTYADDKSWLQARGVACLLIISNYDPEIDDLNIDRASDVVNSPSTYVPAIVSIATTDGWDGITLNLEAVPEDDRDAATNFIAQLAGALHAVGKLLHITVPARTNTDYDAGSEWWTNWCDFGAVVRHVDAMKVMTYTESGPYDVPGPHAPDWFMQAVYDYIDSVVPRPFRRRVLVGANAYGHIWDDTADDPDDAEYTTYNEAITHALWYAAPMRLDNTELHWSKGPRRCWAGSPLTMLRATRIAAERGYGGVGIWKADDGDEEMFADVAQIGIHAMTGFIDVQFPPKIAYGATGGPEYSTIVNTADNGEEQRSPRWSYPLARYNVTHSLRSQADLEELLAFFRLVQGRLNSFRFKDYSDHTCPRTLLGVGDGTQTTFLLRKGYSYQGFTTWRRIKLPIAASVKVWLGDAAQPSGWTLDDTVGEVSFTNAPGAGVEVYASCQFDVQCRLDVDRLSATIETYSAAKRGYLNTWSDIEIVEVRS